MSDYRGIAFWSLGWTGTVVLDGGAPVTPYASDGHASPFTVAAAIALAGVSTVHASFAWELVWDDANQWAEIRFTCDNAFTLALTGTLSTRLGFGSSYSGGSATSHTATAGSHGAWVPYSDHGIDYRLSSIPVPSSRSAQAYGATLWSTTPGQHWRQPVLQASAMRASALRFAEAWASASTPGKVDVINSSQVIETLHCGTPEMAQRSSLSGWSDIEIEVIR